VRAIRADVGRLVWVRWLVEPGDILRPPVAYHSTEMDAVVFTCIVDVVFLDPKTGLELKRIKLRSASLTPVALAEEVIYSVGPERRMGAVGIKDGLPKLRMRTHGELRIPPLYLPDTDLLVLADDTGTVAGVRGRDRAPRFAKQFSRDAQGWLAADAHAVYFCTAEPRVYGLDRSTGDTVLEYRLPKPPAGGPVVTRTSIYQATYGGGVQRIGVNPEWPNWFADQAKQFLAEWPRQVVLLRTDGKVELVRRETGESQAILDVGPVAEGISNVWTDAAIVASRAGQIQCIRPVEAKPLALADFRPLPTTQPGVAATQPAKPEATSAPAQKTGQPAAKTTAGPGQPATAPSPPAPSDDERLLKDPLRSAKDIAP